jgi:hypothetical protein
MAQSVSSFRIPIKFEKHWAPSLLIRKLFHFCGTHKHPSWEDEREFRILAYPINQAEARVFTGIAHIKAIRESPTRKKYIDLGDSWRPGIEPERIIIGPKADKNILHIAEQFNTKPLLSVSDIPIK